MLGLRRTSAVAAVVLAPVLLLVAGISLYDRDDAPAVGVDVALADDAAVGVLGPADLATTITSLQSRLTSVPDDLGSWSTLGFAYVAQARATADPSYYPKAEEAFGRVLAEAPDDADALSGRAALANARHAFGEGRDLARRAVESDAYNATAKGVLADSQLELGEYDAALATLQEMVDLRPGVASFTRASYSYELRGDLEGARYALNRALETAQATADISFVRLHLGDLAHNAGDYAGAAEQYRLGLRADPTNVPLLAARARTAAALGDSATALADYATVVQTLPQPSYLVEYGELLDRLGQPELAQEQYAVADAAQQLFTAAGVEPDIELTLYAADHGRPADALTMAMQQYELRRSVQVEDAMAWALHVNGRNEEALTHALAAQQLGTRSALWDYHRGMIQLALGLEDDARTSLASALDTSPQFSPLHAPLARAALDGLGAGG